MIFFKSTKIPLNIYGPGNKLDESIARNISNSLGISKTNNGKNMKVSHVRRLNKNKLRELYNTI